MVNFVRLKAAGKALLVLFDVAERAAFTHVAVYVSNFVTRKVCAADTKYSSAFTLVGG